MDLKQHTRSHKCVYGPQSMSKRQRCSAGQRITHRGGPRKGRLVRRHLPCPKAQAVAEEVSISRVADSSKKRYPTAVPIPTLHPISSVQASVGGPGSLLRKELCANRRFHDVFLGAGGSRSRCLRSERAEKANRCRWCRQIVHEPQLAYAARPSVGR